MILINFAHALTPEQLERVEALAGRKVERLIPVPSQFDQDQPLAPQAIRLVDDVGLAPEEWQTKPLLVYPPGHSSLALLVLAEVHGRAGYFPRVLRLKPVPGGDPPFQPAEVLDLQAVRDAARQRR